MIRHIVLFSYKKEATAKQLETLHEKFNTLPSLIPEILHFESGKNISSENKSKGLSNAYVLDFAGIKERDCYLVHPDHMAFSEFADSLLEDVLVFDYKANVIV